MPPCRGNDSLCFQAPQLPRNVCVASRTQSHQQAKVASSSSSSGFLLGSAFFCFVFRVFIPLSCNGNKEKQNITKQKKKKKEKKEKKRLSRLSQKEEKYLNKQKVTRKANRQGLFVEDPDGRPGNLSKMQSTGLRCLCGAHQSAIYILIPNPTGHPETHRWFGKAQTSLK